MFGEFIIVSGIALVTGLTSKVLEDAGKEKAAKYLDIAFHGGMAIYALKMINDLFDDVTDFL